uniref:Uncharacterized protein n=1 Tax=Arundo donax TaxID=35708 RepID=A0A0A9GQL4_ARUDO
MASLPRTSSPLSLSLWRFRSLIRFSPFPSLSPAAS